MKIGGVLLLFFSLISQAQFFDKDGQIWVGLRGSINWSQIAVETNHDVVLGNSDGVKNYRNITPYGGGIGILFTYEMNDFLSVSLQPHYDQVVFGYTSTYLTTGSEELELKNEFDHSLDYINIPLLVRLELPFDRFGRFRKTRAGGYTSSGKKGTFTPFVEFGGQYGKLVASRKRIQSSTKKGEAAIASSSALINAYDLLNHDQWSLLFGGGVSYDIAGSFRVALSSTYTLGLNNVANGKTRYSNEVMTQQHYDVFDDFKWRNINLELHFLFPIKFMVSGNFRAL